MSTLVVTVQWSVVCSTALYATEKEVRQAGTAINIRCAWATVSG